MNKLCKQLMSPASQSGGVKSIDFSEVPSDILPLMVSLIARLIFSVQQWMDKDKFNEYIMTNLRTMWGIQEEKMQLQFPDFSKTVRPKLAPFLENGSVVCQNGRIRLTEKGWLVSDDVFSDLFVV